MRIGLIGLGNMGYPLFQNLLKHRYYVNVLLENNNNEVIHQCNTYYINQLNRFIENSDKIISVLPKNKITLDIVNNINLKNNKLKYWIDLCSCSTDLNDKIIINNKLSELNIKYIDCPINGNNEQMKKGEVSTIINCSKNTYNDCKDIINIYAGNILS